MSGDREHRKRVAEPSASRSVPRLMLDEASFVSFLAERRPHPPVLSMDGLDGYLTALIIGPRFIDPRRWIPLFVGETALMAAAETPEARAVQTLATNYNRISTALAETPAKWRPHFVRRQDTRFNPFFWSTGFLLGTGFAPRLWRPVLQGHPDTGDIIAPIRKMADAKVLLDETEVAAIAKAVVAIRSHFMPKRAKARF
ncbi:YecA family protein [Jiella sp. M17.18]|uniref:YecA/YgfB family protein n=1 Tax=Jiella sp. M17.18 TaxID=3234247 RepID=UPI0034DFE3BF